MSYRDDLIRRLTEGGIWQSLDPEERRELESKLDDAMAREVLVVGDDLEFSATCELLAQLKDGNKRDAQRIADRLFLAAAKSLRDAHLVSMNGDRPELTPRGRKLAEFVDVSLSEKESPFFVKLALQEITIVSLLALRGFLHGNG